jgi:hypothetical protein
MLVGLLLAVPTAQFFLHGAPLQAKLGHAVLDARVRDSMDDYGGLVYRSYRERSSPAVAGEATVFFTGSSAMGFSVNIPLAQRLLQEEAPAARVRIENYWAQNATISDSLRWLEALPADRPSVLVLGLYYKAFEPSKRKPFVRHSFPINNASLGKTLYAAHTVDRSKSWDPNGAAPPTDGYWDPQLWEPSQGTGYVAEDLLPLDRLPNSETDALHQLIRLCKERSIQLLIIRTPIHPALYEEYRKVIDYPAYDRFMQSIATEVRVLNWESLLDNPADFVNMQHTSGSGRDHCTQELARALAPLLTTDRRAVGGRKPTGRATAVSPSEVTLGF